MSQYQVPATVAAQVAPPEQRITALPSSLTEVSALTSPEAAPVALAPANESLPLTATNESLPIAAANDYVPLAAAPLKAPRWAQMAAVNAEHKAHLNERKLSFERWLTQHPVKEQDSSACLKPELSAKLTTTFPPKATQVNVLCKCLRAHPITLVPEAQQETTHCRTSEQQLQCDYMALVLKASRPRSALQHLPERRARFQRAQADERRACRVPVLGPRLPRRRGIYPSMVGCRPCRV